MPPEPTARDCVAACDRLCLKLDQARALLAPLPAPDPAALDRMHAAAEQALSSWGTPPGWDEWGT